MYVLAKKKVKLKDKWQTRRSNCNLQNKELIPQVVVIVHSSYVL